MDYVACPPHEPLESVITQYKAEVTQYHCFFSNTETELLRSSDEPHDRYSCENAFFKNY